MVQRIGGCLFAAWSHALEWQDPWPEGTETARMAREAVLVCAPVLFAGYMVDDWRLAIALLILPTIANSAYYGPAYGAAQASQFTTCFSEPSA